MQHTEPMLDARGCSVSGATRGALDAYEAALAAFQSWRNGAQPRLATALQEAPDFVMAHVLQAHLALSSRDPERVRSARPVLERAARLPANERERMHLAAISAVLADDYELAKARFGDLLRVAPRDALALQVAHSLDYITGDLERMSDRVAAVLPAWSADLPGYHAVLAMYAFSLVECGEYALGEQTALDALALNPSDARAHHAMAHVFEMTGRPEAGRRWMEAHVDRWDVNTVVATHCWWHLALFYLEQGRHDRVLELYDQRIQAGGFSQVADMIDASSLLWRLHLRGIDVGSRWLALAAAWEPHIHDGFCSFNDLHAMLSFVGAGDWDNARRLETFLDQCQSLPTRHGATTRLLGLSACRALIAFEKGKHTLAITLLASLPESAHRLGGSHAQRDVLHLTMLHAIQIIRRPSRSASTVLLTA
ncbi:MAG: Peptidylprolyl isomerase [Herminiimonas sp.]|nr:Peptidylprolyl isomerase [Herminiimonas sp.]MDB5855504.1 Peptidylprolyl isomerase [Herminiimonas sp.]